MKRRKKVRCVVALVTLASLAPASQAAAQDASMSNAQIERLNEANAELGAPEPDLKRARALTEKALASGQRFDLLLLTHARVLQLQDECDRAQEVFDEIPRAPREPSQPAEVIENARQAYLGQMGDLCSGSVEVTCVTPSLEVELDGQAVACGATVRVRPGSHVVRYGLATPPSEEARVEVRGREVVPVRLEVAPEVVLEDPPHEDKDPVVSEGSALPTVLLAGGGVLLVAGAASAGGGYWMGSTNVTQIREGEVTQPEGRDAANTANALLMTGAALGAVGAGLLVTGLMWGSGEGDVQALRLDVWVDPLGRRVQLKARF